MCRSGAGLCVVGALLAPVSAWATGTRAGTDISNVATATYTDPGGQQQAVDSNVAVVRVAEVLDLTLTSNDARAVLVTSPDTGDALSFTLTNTGNGSEAFSLVANPALPEDQYDPTLVSLVLDANHNGIYEPGIDPVHVAGVNDPLLEPDASIIVFAVHDTPGSLHDGDIGRSRLSATAVTGSGTPGTLFAGRGDGGVDAVVGTSTATHGEIGSYTVARIGTSLLKAQAVADPFGGSVPVPGAIVTYTLTFSANGVGSLTSVQIADPIPQHTRYEPGSLTLDGSALTDVADADAGRFTGSGIEVALGTIVAPATRLITFRVRIE